MKTKPTSGRRIEPPLRWSLNQAAREFNAHREQLERRRRAIGIEQGEDRKYSTQDILAMIGGSMEAEKLRKLKADADLAKIEVAKERGAVLPVTDVLLMGEAVLMCVKARVWASSIPEDERREILTELSKMRFGDVVPNAERKLGYKLTFEYVQEPPAVVTP